MTQSESIWVDLIQISKMIKIVWQLLLKVSKLSNFWIFIYFCLWSRLWDSRSSKLPNRQTHTMHVWYIYQHLPLTNHHTSPSVGKYAQHRVAIRWWCPTHFQTHDTPKYHISLVSYLPKNLPAVCIPWSSMRSHEIPWQAWDGRHGLLLRRRIRPCFARYIRGWTQTWATTPTRMGWYHGMLKIYLHLV